MGSGGVGELESCERAELDDSENELLIVLALIDWSYLQLWSFQ